MKFIFLTVLCLSLIGLGVHVTLFINNYPVSWVSFFSNQILVIFVFGFITILTFSDKKPKRMNYIKIEKQIVLSEHISERSKNYELRRFKQSFRLEVEDYVITEEFTPEFKLKKIKGILYVGVIK